MAPSEIGITVVGLLVGYWIVSYLLDFRRPDTDARQSAELPGSKEMQDGNENWWTILGVEPNAAREDIAAAYKRKISEYHPDKVAHMGEEIRALASRRAQAINAAYDEALRLRN